MPGATQQTVWPALELRPPRCTPRDPGAGQDTHLAVHHLGMLEDGDDVAHHGHAQLIHDLLVEVQQHALLDPAWGVSAEATSAPGRKGQPAPGSPHPSPLPSRVSSVPCPLGLPYLLSTNITA